MARYYEDKKIIEALQALQKSPWAQGFDNDGILAEHYHNGIKEALTMLIDIIRGDVPDCLKIEAADVTPVKPGTWKKGNDYYFHCSECGSSHTKTEMLHCKFCPDCGARLDAKGDA